MTPQILPTSKSILNPFKLTWWPMRSGLRVFSKIIFETPYTYWQSDFRRWENVISYFFLTKERFAGLASVQHPHRSTKLNIWPPSLKDGAEWWWWAAVFICVCFFSTVFLCCLLLSSLFLLFCLLLSHFLNLFLSFCVLWYNCKAKIKVAKSRCLKSALNMIIRLFCQNCRDLHSVLQVCCGLKYLVQ